MLAVLLVTLLDCRAARVSDARMGVTNPAEVAGPPSPPLTAEPPPATAVMAPPAVRRLRPEETDGES